MNEAKPSHSTVPATEHFTSNPGQIQKYHFSPPRTPQETRCQLHGAWQTSKHTGCYIFYLSACEMKDLLLGDTLSRYVYSLHFLTKQFQTPGSQIPKYPLQSTLLHRPHLGEHSKQSAASWFSLGEARLGHSWVNQGQSKQRSLFDHWLSLWDLVEKLKYCSLSPQRNFSEENQDNIILFPCY